jgi:hypothetical protein
MTAPLRPQSAEPSRLNPVEWADDFLRRDVSQQYLIEKYGLKVRLGESILAAMFEAYARTLPSAEQRFDELRKKVIERIMSGRTINNFAHVPTVVRALEWVWADVDQVFKEDAEAYARAAAPQNVGSEEMSVADEFCLRCGQHFECAKEKWAHDCPVINRAAAPAAPLPQEPHLSPVEKSILDTTTNEV